MSGHSEETEQQLHAHALLAIDTSMHTSVSLRLTGGTLPDAGATRSNSDPRGHAESIGPMLSEVFELSGATPADVTGVVVGIGPGLFTGLRVGIAAARAFARARNVPFLPVSGHEAVAYEALRGGAERVRVIQDAKRRELFVTEYDGLDEDGLPNCTAESHLVHRSEYVPEGRDIWPEHINAELMPALALLRLSAGRDFAQDRALYLRAPDVQAPNAPKRVST
ncbi:tRNA (adenosine(37)-N6)-threonylcarbamoyltransferase complex dimerization subunit type 1 TsaB [Leucobacter sp. GX24907]